MCKIKQFESAVILAGGKSTRMGFDKQFAKCEGKTLVDIIVNKLKIEFDEIIVVTNKKDEYKDKQYIVVSDEIKNKGPLSGIHIGLKTAKSKYVYFVACDMPMVNTQYIKHMKKIIKNHECDICVTNIDGFVEPLNAFYSKKILPLIERNIKNDKKSLKNLIKIANTFEIEGEIAREYSPYLSMFENLNTQDDLNGYIKKMSGGAKI